LISQKISLCLVSFSVSPLPPLPFALLLLTFSFLSLPVTKLSQLPFAFASQSSLIVIYQPFLA
jgi:hypothetical protein